jgi:hypothetical protein
MSVRGCEVTVGEGNATGLAGKTKRAMGASICRWQGAEPRMTGPRAAAAPDLAALRVPSGNRLEALKGERNGQRLRRCGLRARVSGPSVRVIVAAGSWGRDE